MQPVDVWTPPFGVHLVQLDRLDPQVTRDLLVVRLGSLGSDMLEAMHGLDVDPTAVSGPGVTDAPALTLQQPLDDLLGQLGAFHQCPPTRGEFLPTRLAAQPLDVLVLAGPRAMGDVACPLRAPTGTAQIGTRECAIVVTLWRERWIRHGIGLPMGIGTDSATFPSDFNCPVVIFLQDYPVNTLMGYFQSYTKRKQNDRLHGCRQPPLIKSASKRNIMKRNIYKQIFN
jgi:hypothetical protein